MKTTKHNVQRLLLAVMLLGMAACTGDFADINRNPNEVTDEQLQANNYKIGTNLKTLQGLVVPTQEHMYQFLESLVGGPYAGYIGATVDTWQNKFETFNPSADWRKWPFVNVISETYPAYRAIINGTDDVTAHALAAVCRIAIMQRVSDSYGPIPYTQIMADKTESLEVAYDTQQEAYMAMFEELDAAIASLEDNLTLPSDAFGRYDGVYAGNIAQWLKFANSLKLRMAMRLTYVDEATARTKAAEAIAGGVITANADNARMQTSDNRMTLIYNDWGDHRVGADILCYMNGYKDPRRAKMFTQGTVGEGDAAEKGYYGLRIGTTPANKSKAVTACSSMLITDTDPILWMNAAEIAFLRSEYELRWGSAVSAQNFYEQGIRLSFEERGVAGAEDYIADEANVPEAYTDPLGVIENNTALPQSRITIKWKEDAQFEENLERIITQKWIAIFPLGNEAWAEYRRTGYPKLMPAKDNKSGGTVNSKYGMRRLPYPSEEYSENRTNVEAAITSLGGPDNGGTRTWWDCKPLN